MNPWTNRVLGAFGLLLLLALLGGGAWAQPNDDARPQPDPPAAERPTEDGEVDEPPQRPDGADEGESADDPDDGDDPEDGEDLDDTDGPDLPEDGDAADEEAEDGEDGEDGEEADEAEPTEPADDQPVSVRYEIFVVSEVTNEDGERQERLVEATSARPGQTVEYRVFARNEGDTTLPPGLVTVTGPVPEGTEFLDDSATPSSERVRTEFSADGGATFGEPPVLVGSGEDQEAVAPSSFDAVRWTLLEPMEPGQEETFFYRVIVR